MGVPIIQNASATGGAFFVAGSASGENLLEATLYMAPTSVPDGATARLQASIDGGSTWHDVPGAEWVPIPGGDPAFWSGVDATLFWTGDGNPFWVGAADAYDTDLVRIVIEADLVRGFLDTPGAGTDVTLRVASRAPVFQ